MSEIIPEPQAYTTEPPPPNTFEFADPTPEIVAGINSDTSRFGFRIGNLGFLFPKNCPGEILIAPSICPIPYTRKWMPGVIPLRGSLIPVFDLHDLLLGTPLVDNKPMILILDQGKRAFGFVLKESPRWLTGLAEVSVDSIRVPDPADKLVNKAYRHQETTWLAFSKTDLFTFLGENAKSC